MKRLSIPKRGLFILLLVALVSVGACSAEDPHLDDFHSSADIYARDGYFDGIFVGGVPVGGGVVDHGALLGLADDDHPQYHNDARGDARYYTQANLDGGQLDGRYYTEAELDAGQLDARYYTEVELDAGQLDNRYYTEVELDAGQLDTRYYTEAETDTEIDTDIATHSALATGVHDVDTGTVSSVSTANKDIYVDKEAVGAGDGTSWADAFTTIQAAIDSIEDVIIHDYTINVRDGTKKTGTADENTANHLVDDASSQFVVGDVGKRVFNITDGTWGVVSSFVDAGDVGIVGENDVALDLFPAGTEDYVMEPTPYRETIYLNSNPAVNPAHVILGSLTIEGEYYWRGDCDANANVGEIKHVAADFSNVELGDKVMVLAFTGAQSRCIDYEIGTVDDITQIGAGIVRTNLTKTPTTAWDYHIYKGEISASDDGTVTGQARDAVLDAVTIDNVTFQGFIITWADLYAVSLNNCRGWYVYYNYFDGNNCDRDFRINNSSVVLIYYNYLGVADNFAILCNQCSLAECRYNAMDGVGTATNIQCSDASSVKFSYGYIDTALRALRVQQSWGYLSYLTISANSATGLYVRANASVITVRVTNNGVIPEDPAGTAEGAYVYIQAP